MYKRQSVSQPTAAVGSPHADLLSWSDPPPKYSETPAANELLSLLDPLSASSNQVLSPTVTRSGSGSDLKSAGLTENNIFPYMPASIVVE